MAVLLTSLIADILYVLADPRIRITGGQENEQI
jgi:ABC-type dipeptide/oligopeptide/nickel transport system permease component